MFIKRKLFSFIMTVVIHVIHTRVGELDRRLLSSRYPDGKKNEKNSVISFVNFVKNSIPQVLRKNSSS